jgi:hypothetical protein
MLEMRPLMATKTLTIEIREVSTTIEGKAITYLQLVLPNVPTYGGKIDVVLKVAKDYQKQYLKDYLKTLRKE